MKFPRFFRKREPFSGPEFAHLDAQDLEAIRDEVLLPLAEHTQTETGAEQAPGGQNGPQKSKLALFPDDSHNHNSDENLEMKLIRTLNELENLKVQIDSSTATLREEISSIRIEINRLSSLVDEIPKEAVKELGNIRKLQADTYHELKQSIGSTVKTQMLDDVDHKILSIIKDTGKINSRDLLDAVVGSRICSKNTHFLRLKRLEDMGMILKRRSNHEVFYSVADPAVQELSQYAQEQAKAAATPSADQPVESVMRQPPASTPPPIPAAPTNAQAPPSDPAPAVPAPAADAAPPPPEQPTTPAQPVPVPA